VKRYVFRKIQARSRSLSREYQRPEALRAVVSSSIRPTEHRDIPSVWYMSMAALSLSPITAPHLCKPVNHSVASPRSHRRRCRSKSPLLSITLRPSSTTSDALSRSRSITSTPRYHLLSCRPKRSGWKEIKMEPRDIRMCSRECISGRLTGTKLHLMPRGG